jgi:drug/metabolite transporter (DMT)-like permease
MVDLLLGITAAVGASTLYSLGIGFQAMGVREAPREQNLRLGLFRDLLRRSRWVLGTGLSLLGWPLQVVALMFAPLVVVQPALAVGLLVLLLIAERLLGERAGRYEYLAIGAILLGVLGAALCAPGRSTNHSSEELAIALVLLGLALAALAPYMLRAIGRSYPALTMVCAGLAFAWSGVSTKLASDDLSRGDLTGALLWSLATGLASIMATLSETSALQERPAIQVAPIVFVAQTVVPVVLAPLILGESFRDTPLGGLPLGASLALLVAGAAMLARSPLLVALMEADQDVNEESVSLRSPSASSAAMIRSSPATEAPDPSSSTTSTSPARIGR